MDFTAKNVKKNALNQSEASYYIGVSSSTLSRWRHEGIGPKYKSVILPGKTKPRILYPVKCLNEWLDAVVETA